MEGDVDATITGTAIMWEDAANTLRPVSAAKPLPVSSSPSPVPICELGVVELVGVDEQVDNGELSKSVSVPLGGTYSGELLNFAFYAAEDGTGAVQDSGGYLLILDADPAVAAGDTDLAAAEWPTVLGIVKVEASDWIVDANGGMAYITDTPVPFHALSTLYFVWLHNDATSLNDAAGDEERLAFNAWYRRDS
jgi:hypothetical protein